MFAAYCEQQSLVYVAAKCGICEITCGRYRASDNWDARIADIKAKANEKADKAISNRLAENLKLVRFAKNRLVLKINNGEDKSSSTYKDLDNMIRLEEFLMGRPDSRPAAGDYEKMSDEELQRRLEVLEGIPNEPAD
jgi:hypothetical protein